MYDITVRRHALALLEQSLTISEVSRRTGVSRGAIREWLLRSEQGRDLYAHPHRDCPRAQLYLNHPSRRTPTPISSAFIWAMAASVL
jgi:transposase-like protein